MSCGSCTLCCKVMSVPEIEKPSGAWCSDCDPGHGCNVYDERPKSCREFECVWLQMQAGDTNWAPELRPDRSHVVFMVTQKDKLAIYVDPARPDADTKPDVRRFIEIAKQNRLRPVSVVAGKGAVEREFNDPVINQQIRERHGIRNLLQPSGFDEDRSRVHASGPSSSRQIVRSVMLERWVEHLESGQPRSG